MPKPRSAFPPSDPLKRPVPLPRSRVVANNDRVTASDIFRSISTVSKQITEDVAAKVSNSAKTASERIENSFIDGSRFAKGTLEKTLTTSRAVRDSVTKSVIEGTKTATAGLKLRRVKRNDINEDGSSQRCTSMPVVDVSLFDNIQFHSPLLEQKKYRNEMESFPTAQDLPSLNVNSSYLDDLSLFSSNSDSNTDTVSNFSGEYDHNSSLPSESEQMTYDTPKQSRANSIASIRSAPEVPERRKKREQNIMDFMRQNSLYENWTLPNKSSNNNENTNPRPSKSTIYEFDPLNTSAGPPKFEGVSNELLLLESFLIGDTYGTIVANDSSDDNFEDFHDIDYFNPPTPPERSDSLLDEANEKKSATVDKERQSNWFVTDTDTQLIPEEEVKPSNSVMQKFSHMLKLDRTLSKTSKTTPAKVEVVDRPPINQMPISYFSGTLTRIVSGIVEDLFKNSQTRYCVLSDQKLMCYTDPTNSVLKEAYMLDSVYSVQLVLPLSSRFVIFL